MLRWRQNLLRFQRGLAAILTLIIYVGAYGVLSAQGDWYPSQSGGLRYKGGFAVTDIERWQPAWAHWEALTSVDGRWTSRGNWQGYLFSPLISLDRAWFHPDVVLLQAEDLTQPSAVEPVIN